MKSNQKISTDTGKQNFSLEHIEPLFLEKLAKAKIDFESLGDHISQGLARCEIICDTKGIPYDYKILNANTAYERHTGISREISVGKTILEIYPDMEKSWIETYGRVALTQKTEIIEGYNHNTKRYYRSVAYSDKRGEFMMLFEDTTHQVELEKAYELVSKSTKLNSDLLGNMQDGFKHCLVICDEVDHPINFKILSINEAYEKQTGIKKEQIVGKTMLDVFPEMDDKKLQDFCSVGITGISKNFIDHCTFTGRIFDISAFSPKSKEFILIVRDITEKENARVNLEKAYKKVEESEKLKSAFLANMSHEIRTPLNAILGFAELLQEQDLKTGDQKRCLENIKSSGTRLLNIVSDILDISKLEANQQQLNYGTHNLNDIIDGIFEQFKVINTNSCLEIKVGKGLTREESYIETDATRLEQILSNLLENALKHTKKGWVCFGYRLKEDFLEFFVEDTGSGIHLKDQKTIFERFGQVNDETIINRGTGLGIPIAAGLAKLFGGKMWVDSEPKNGSTFYFTIPYRPVSNEKVKDEKPLILVAEDEEANFLLLEMWLKKYARLIHATDGNETVELAKTNQDIDLILMDIKMPYLNGIEATREIRKLDKDIPIIAQTAFVMENEKKDILAAGCNEILSKPIRNKEFKGLLSHYISQLKFD